MVRPVYVVVEDELDTVIDESTRTKKREVRGVK